MWMGIIVILTMIVVFGGFQYLAEKFAGVRYHGKFGYGEAKRQADSEKETFELCAKLDPDGISKAIESCKKKHYKLTHGNILSEYNKN